MVPTTLRLLPQRLDSSRQSAVAFPSGAAITMAAQLVWLDDAEPIRVLPRSPSAGSRRTARSSPWQPRLSVLTSDGRDLRVAVSDHAQAQAAADWSASARARLDVAQGASDLRDVGIVRLLPARSERKMNLSGGVSTRAAAPSPLIIKL